MQNEEEYDQEFGDFDSEPVAEYYDGTTSKEDEKLPENGIIEDDASQEVKKKEFQKPKKDDLREKFSEIRRENYQVLSENDKLRQENEKLRQEAEYSTQTAMRHYDDGVNQRLSGAKEMFKQAEESGDIQAKADAAAYLSMVAAEVQNLNNLKAQQTVHQKRYQEEPQNVERHQYSEQRQYEQPQSGIDYAKEREYQRWYSENSWIDKNSKDYDPWLSEKVTRYAADFNQNLIRGGQADGIGSPEYVDIINEAVRKFRNDKSTQGSRGPAMSQSRMPMSSVRNSGGSNEQQYSQRGQRVELTAAEKQFARLSGVDPKVYETAKLNDIRNNAHLRQNVGTRR